MSARDSKPRLYKYEAVLNRNTCAADTVHVAIFMLFWSRVRWLLSPISVFWVRSRSVVPVNDSFIVICIIYNLREVSENYFIQAVPR
jgi:hypothetical protein